MAKNIFEISPFIKVDLSKVSFILIPSSHSKNLVRMVVDGQTIELPRVVFTSNNPNALLIEWEKFHKE